MNIAFGTILVILLILPGLICRKIYYSGELSKKFINQTFLDELLNSIYIAFFIHLITILIVLRFDYIIDYDLIYKLLIGSNVVTLSSLNINPWNILLYFILATLPSITISFSWRNFLRTAKLDRKIKYLRYDNKWHYILSGEILQFKENNGNKINLKKIRRYVDVLVKTKDYDILYSGIIVDYQLSRDNSFEFIVLSEPKYKKFGSDDIQKEIPSTYFVIPYKEILNVNLTYLEELD